MRHVPNPAQAAGAGAGGAWNQVGRREPASPGTPVRIAGLLFLSMLLAGCRHKTVWTPPASLTAPIALDIPDEPQDPGLIAEVPPPVFVPPEPVEPPKPPARRRAPAAPTGKEATPPPAQVASAEDPASLAIGSLSTGDDLSPQVQQQARDLIGSIQKRIQALPRSTASQQKSQLRQVTNFLKRAQQALDSGDADGAMTLATKARLIMDDIDKK